MKRHLLALILGLGACASAQSYRVEGSGGPIDLSARLAEAAAAWNEAAEGAELEEEPGAATVFSFAEPELMGPDLVSATLVREGEEGFEVWLNPATIEEFPQALLHELGLLIGVPAADSGVMDPALSSDSPAAPTEADLEALARALASAGGDLDGDGDVDIRDLAALGRAYGQEGVNLAADLDGDGEVDADDVALLRENYTFTEPRPVAEEPEGAGAEEDRDPAPAEVPGGAADEEPDQTEGAPAQDPGGTADQEPEGTDGAPAQPGGSGE
ncbi:MAG TPA: dockerin type I domain-containing protein [Trueperaceae bacterium]